MILHCRNYLDFIGGMHMREIKIENGQTLIIRKPTVDDAENMIKYLNQVGGESDFLLFGENEFRLTIEQEKKFIESFNNQSHSIMLIGEINGEIISISQISSPTRERIKHTSELAISVLKDYWGYGVGRGSRGIPLGQKSSTLIKLISI